MVDIGIEVPEPKEACDDPHCPFHGSLKVRGQILEGRVVSAKSHRTVVVERRYVRYDRKYERYEKRVSRYPAHNPKCLKAGANDRVRIMECRPISKTKSFVVIQVMG